MDFVTSNADIHTGDAKVSSVVWTTSDEIPSVPELKLEVSYGRFARLVRFEKNLNHWHKSALH